MSVWVRDADIWKPESGLSIRDAGVWKSHNSRWVRDSGVWKESSGEIVLSIDAATTDYNVRTEVENLGWDGNSDLPPITVVVNADVNGTDAANAPAIVTGDFNGWLTAPITIENNDRIVGKGGTGGESKSGFSDPIDPTEGGTGIFVSGTDTVDLKNYGTISGGGGGGGYHTAQGRNIHGGGGAAYGDQTSSGSAPTLTVGGVGETETEGFDTWIAGDGGDWGNPGQDSNGGHPGAQAGYAIVNTSQVNYVVTGTLRGRS